MDFRTKENSKVSQYDDKHSRTTIPKEIMKKLNWAKTLDETKTLFSYQFMGDAGKLILTLKRVSEEDLEQLIAFFKTKLKIMLYEKLRVYVTSERGSYQIRLENHVTKYIDAKHFVNYAIFEVNKEKYLIISGDAIIHISLDNE